MDERMAAIDAKQELIVETLGPVTALDAILRALDYDTKNETFDFIIRMYDLEGGDTDDG